MTKKKVLYVISCPAMSSFATGFLQAVRLSSIIDPFVIIFTEFNDNRTKEMIVKDFDLTDIKIERIKIIQYSKSKLRVHIFQRKYNELIKEFSREYNLDKIHFLTQDTLIAYNLSVFKNMSLYYTVHDLFPHEAKLTALGHLKRFLLLTLKDKIIIKRINNLVTSSEHQLLALQKLYPKKKLYQHDMPSLITPEIKSGNIKVKELVEFTDYVLFFGRIELYKGIEKLYKAFIENQELADTPLVIAGRGNIYFERDISKEKSIRFINRFISDNEMNDLFKKAKIVVLPYISATQSAVTSLPYFYKKPMVVSNILGLKESVIDKKTALLFDPNKDKDLDDKIINLLKDSGLYGDICVNQVTYEDQFYGLNKLVKSIEIIYN